MRRQCPECGAKMRFDGKCWECLERDERKRDDERFETDFMALPETERWRIVWEKLK